MWCVQSSVSCLFGFKTFSCNLVWNPNNQNTQYHILFFMIQCPFICSYQSSSFFYQSSSFLKQDIDLLQRHMAIWQAASCQLCQLRLNHRTEHIYLTTVPLLFYDIVDSYILVWFPYNMLLVRRSDGDWQLTKSALQKVYFWFVFVCSYINSNPDTVATVQSVQSVHNLTLLQRSRKGCQYFLDFGWMNTSFQG